MLRERWGNTLLRESLWKNVLRERLGGTVLKDNYCEKYPESEIGEYRPEREIE